MARRVPVPDEVARMDLVDRVDHADAFAAAAPPHVLARWTPERLLTHTTAGAPRWLMQVLVPMVHRALMLHLDPAAPAVGPRGWRQLDGFPDAAVIGADGPLFTFRLVVTTSSGDLLIATVTRYEHAVARPVWGVVTWGHRAVIRYLVGLGARLAVAEAASGLPR